ncbi:TPA: hypothetical protein JFP82_002173 [Vibrio cholerae O1]|uniref:hypothetical protein n=1 Tax=Vibrio cholerae TaxID=666 RepID=UPI0004E307A3|nr:hypothetical protein [Vibrio cholerae]HAU9839369.1 hypothetical protein [Vibrio cholerae O1]KFE29016.1 hypothetical protein DN30_338 [Vibrio cholerae]MBY4642061.1 hypothetical protein [Vibrio cholerae]MCR9658333.1 hypothetical protein [Vibrio cholerae]MCR9689015.1 hypothetical protein [Vibrio cholerae]
MTNKKLFLFYACVIIVIFVGVFTLFSTAYNMKTKINESVSKARAEALLIQEEHKAARQKLENELDATSIELSRISEIHSELYVDCMWKTDHNKLLCLSNLKDLTDTETFEAMKGKVLNLNQINEGDSNVNKK